MFGKRSDGKKAKNISAIQKLIPHIMFKRNDSQNLYVNATDCAPLDNYIQVKREEGISYNYMHIVIAATVRLFMVRKELNRFIMNGRIYNRYAKDGRNISIAITVKKYLSDLAADTTIKLLFTGKETLAEVKEIVDAAVKANTASKQEAIKEANETDKAAKFITNMPNGLIKFSMSTIKWLDKHGMVPKKLLAASPFHSSCYITNLKSIKTGYIFHHLYNFGTTSMFISMGKEEMSPIVTEDNEIKIAKLMRLGITMDERVTDGFYYAKSLRIYKEVLGNPFLLDKPYVETEE